MKRENGVKWYPIEIERDNFNIKGRTNGEVTFKRKCESKSTRS